MDLIQQTADLFQIDIDEQQQAQFDTLARELRDWNTHMNLTAITDPADLTVRHFLDSLSLVRVIHFDDGDRLIDVGTGAGFPGLPLAIMFPKLHITLMDSTAKKLAFVDHMIDLLGLENARTLHARAEEAGRDPHHRGAYDVVVARAVARLPALLEYLLPLAKMNGYCIAMKGETAAEELSDAKRALFVLGGEAKPPEPVHLPGVEHTHYLVTVEKVRPTPSTYPRKPGTPTRKPIGQ